MGDHQVRRVEVVGAEGLGERLRGVAPAPGEDGVADVIGGRTPLGNAVGGPQRVGHGNGPVQRHPAHELRVHEMPGLAADLPDPLVRVAPTPRGRVRARHEELPPFRRAGMVRVQLRHEPVGRAEQLPVDVDLALVPGTVAHPHGAAVAPAREMAELALGEVVLAADAEHDLQVAAAADLARRTHRQVVEELVGLVGAGRHPQRLQRERRVPHPGVAVVPVAFPADLLGQRRGRGRHDGAGRLVGQRLQHPSAVVHQVAPRALVALVDPRPRPPRVDRRAQRLVEFGSGQGGRVRLGGGAVRSGRGWRARRRGGRACRRRSRLSSGEWDGAGQHQHVGAPARSSRRPARRRAAARPARTRGAGRTRRPPRPGLRCTPARG